MKIILLKHPKKIAIWEEILVDDEDYDRVMQYTWCIGKNDAILTTNEFTKDGRQTSMRLSRFIMNVTDPDIQVDHKDRNTFNNQKSNLRKCTNSQNMFNQGPQLGRKYKGVCFHIRKNKWIASISVNYKRIHLGSYDNEIAAAKAYDKGSKEYHGEFGYLNFPKT